MSAPRNTQVHPASQGYPRNQWYVAAFSHEVGGETPLARVFLDVPVALFRTAEGQVAALEDTCPHRNLPLSQGIVVGRHLRCGYHGIEFAADGQCARIPQQDVIPAAMRVRSFPVIERWKWIWIWMGDPARADPNLLPDHEWIGVEKPGYTGEPMFVMQMNANFQYMHDNLMDTSHLTFLHPGLLDAGEMATSTYWTRDEGQILCLGRDTPGLRVDANLAAYFRIRPDYPYDRTLTVNTFVPSINIGKQTIRDPAHPEQPPQELYAVNALTPISRRAMHVFHVQVTSYPPEWTDEIRAGVEYIVWQDKVACEAIQARVDQFGPAAECSLRSDQMGIKCRRMIQAMVQAEQAKAASDA